MLLILVWRGQRRRPTACTNRRSAPEWQLLLARGRGRRAAAYVDHHTAAGQGIRRLRLLRRRGACQKRGLQGCEHHDNLPIRLHLAPKLHGLIDSTDRLVRPAAKTTRTNPNTDCSGGRPCAQVASDRVSLMSNVTGAAQDQVTRPRIDDLDTVAHLDEGRCSGRIHTDQRAVDVNSPLPATDRDTILEANELDITSSATLSSNA
jgi:hypothetical protein